MRSQKAKKKNEMLCSLALETAAREQGYFHVAGCDEAGRGCLYGPVYAAAVILPADHPIVGLNDSKQLVEAERLRLAEAIRLHAIAWAVACCEAEEIDRINILQASRLAMKRAVLALATSPDFLLVDATTVDLPIPQRGLIKGDAQSQSIAAASILAKTSRDARLVELDARHPEYGFARHKGYPSPEHLQALAEHGVLPDHRRSYAPVRQLLQPRLL